MAASRDSTLELNDPTSFNAQSSVLMADMASCLDALLPFIVQSDSGSMVFQGVGAYFCTGGDHS